jgi:hypothetical protein
MIPTQGKEPGVALFAKGTADNGKHALGRVNIGGGITIIAIGLEDPLDDIKVQWWIGNVGNAVRRQLIPIRQLAFQDRSQDAHGPHQTGGCPQRWVDDIVRKTIVSGRCVVLTMKIGRLENRMQTFQPKAGGVIAAAVIPLRLPEKITNRLNGDGHEW